MLNVAKKYSVDQTMKLSVRQPRMSLAQSICSARLIRKDFEIPLYVREGESILVGRDENSVGVAIRDAFVSRVHAAIIFENNSFYVRDLHSKNGTFLNDNRLGSHENSRALQDGDCLRFNNVEFHFYMAQTKEITQESLIHD